MNEAEKNRVLSPEMTGATAVLAQAKLNWISVDERGTEEVNDKRKL